MCFFVKSTSLAQNTHDKTVMTATENRVLITQTIKALPLFKAITLGNKISLFFGTQGKISNPDRVFNAEFKYISSFSPSPTVLL